MFLPESMLQTGNQKVPKLDRRHEIFKCTCMLGPLYEIDPYHGTPSLSVMLVCFVGH